jgi:hypothetical protein
MNNNLSQQFILISSIIDSSKKIIMKKIWKLTQLFIYIMYWLFSIVVKAQEPNVHEGCDTSQK